MCQACNHPKREALEQDIRAGLTPAVVRDKYGIPHHAGIVRHKNLHMSEIPALLEIVDSEQVAAQADIELARVDEGPPPAVFDRLDSEAVVAFIDGSETQTLTDDPGKIHKPWKEFPPAMVRMVTNNPLSQFQQAWHLAKDDDRMRAQMVAWLNEQLQAIDAIEISLDI